MATELEGLKNMIEGGESCVYAYEQVDLDKMRKEGNADVAHQIELCLALVDDINEAAGVDCDD